MEDVEADQIDSDGIGGIQIMKEKIGGYECPAFILFEAEEMLIQRPWKI